MRTNTRPSRREDNSDQKKSLHRLILSLLSPKQIRRLRDRYNLGLDTVAELSQKSGCPPVLLYCLLTPLWFRTSVKLRMLLAEKKVTLLARQGFSTKEIARQLRMKVIKVEDYSTGCFAPQMYLFRAWYHDRAPKPKDPNEIEYDESTLPPTSRLGWTDGILTDIPEDRRGRCPECGHIVSLPCHRCRVLRDMKYTQIPRPPEFKAEDEEEEVIEPDLFFT